MFLSEPPEQQRSFLWRITHPREIRRQRNEEKRVKKEWYDRKLQQVMEGVATLHQKHEEWFEVAKNPDSTGDALQHVFEQERDASTNIIGPIYELADNPHRDFKHVLEPMEHWIADFQGAIAAHPNLPPELFHRLGIHEKTVTGLLRNPALPLILLERPDFIRLIPRGNKFARYVLQRTDIPAPLLSMLATINYPWLALEAKTHITAEGFDTSVIPDLDWLENQVISLIRSDTLERRCLAYELACYGLFPQSIEPVVPWEPVDSSAREKAASDPAVMQIVQKTHELEKSSSREYRLLECLRNCRVSEETPNAKELYIELAFNHPEVAPWVRTALAKGWPEATRSQERLIVLRYGEVSGSAMASYRLSATLEALESWEQSGHEIDRGPGIFYFLAQELPHLLEGNMLARRYHRRWRTYFSKGIPVEMVLPSCLERRSFLVRMAIAFRLEDRVPEQKKCRELLCHDPNRYVRAAARREIAWQRRQ